MYVSIEAGSRSGYKMTTAKIYNSEQALYNMLSRCRQKEVNDRAAYIPTCNNQQTRQYLQEAFDKVMNETFEEWLTNRSYYRSSIFDVLVNPTEEEELQRPRKLTGEELVNRFNTAGLDLTSRPNPPVLNSAH